MSVSEEELATVESRLSERIDRRCDQMERRFDQQDTRMGRIEDAATRAAEEFRRFLDRRLDARFRRQVMLLALVAVLTVVGPRLGELLGL